MTKNAMNILSTILMGSLFVVLSACGSGSSGPSKEQVVEAVKPNLPAGVAIEEIRFESFPGEDQHKGRVSVAGKLVTTESRVNQQNIGLEKLEQKVLSLGATPEQYRRFLKRLMLENNPREIVVPTGMKFDFSGELNFFETVDGLKLGGNVQSEVPGRAISDLPKGTLVYDTPEFESYFSKYAQWLHHETVTLPQLAKDVFASLADGAKIVDGQRVLATIEPFDLNAEPWTVATTLKGGRNVGVYTALIPVTIDAASDFMIAWVPLKKGSNDPFHIHLRIYYDNPDPSNACLNLNRRGGAGGVSGELCWDGAKWKWNGSPFLLLNGMEESRTHKQLSIEP